MLLAGNAGLSLRFQVAAWVNVTSRQGIKQLGISFGSIFLLFSNTCKSSPGATLIVARGNPQPLALNDNPGMY